MNFSRNLKSAFDSLAASGYNISANPACVQSVRWRRKPRWLPMAKTKLFKIPPRTILPEEEKHEWLRLNNNYKTQMRSVRAFLREEVAFKEIQVAQELTPADEEAEYQRRSEINDEWNFEISKIRDARIAKENAERREFIKSRLEAKNIRERDEAEKIEAMVRRQKEQSSTFITQDNIEQAIEQALANPVDYNFSIDLSGTIFRGNDAEKLEKKPEDS